MVSFSVRTQPNPTTQSSLRTCFLFQCGGVSPPQLFPSSTKHVWCPPLNVVLCLSLSALILGLSWNINLPQLVSSSVVLPAQLVSFIFEPIFANFLYPIMNLFIYSTNETRLNHCGQLQNIRQAYQVPDCLEEATSLIINTFLLYCLTRLNCFWVNPHWLVRCCCCFLDAWASQEPLHNLSIILTYK